MPRAVAQPIRVARVVRLREHQFAEVGDVDAAKGPQSLGSEARAAIDGARCRHLGSHPVRNEAECCEGHVDGRRGPIGATRRTASLASSPCQRCARVPRIRPSSARQPPRRMASMAIPVTDRITMHKAPMPAVAATTVPEQKRAMQIGHELGES